MGFCCCWVGIGIGGVDTIGFTDEGTCEGIDDVIGILGGLIPEGLA